jgi:hypothetical protein
VSWQAVTLSAVHPIRYVFITTLSFFVSAVNDEFCLYRQFQQYIQGPNRYRGVEQPQYSYVYLAFLPLGPIAFSRTVAHSSLLFDLRLLLFTFTCCKLFSTSFQPSHSWPPSFCSTFTLNHPCLIILMRCPTHSKPLLISTTRTGRALCYRPEGCGFESR